MRSSRTVIKSPTLRNLWQIWLLPLLLTLPGILNLLLYGLPLTHDAVTHLWRIARLQDSIDNFVLFPRWIPEMLLGFGYPVLNYYASASYYLVDLLTLTGLDLHRAFIAAHWLLMWLAAVGMYILARDTYGRQHPWAAYVAAIAYAYGPYLIINIYMRSAIAEIGAQALLPWLFWGFQRIWQAENPKHYVIFTLLTLGALAFTHTISLLIVPPLLAAYNVVQALASSERRSRIPYALAATVGAMGITCFFWAPLMVERGFVADTGFTIAKELMLPIAFLTLPQLVNPHFFFAYAYDAPLTLGLIQTILAIAGFCALIWLMRSPVVKRIADRSDWFFWLGMGIICVVLMLKISEPLWFSNDVLAIIQFPWRLLAALQLPIALLTGLTVILLRPRLIQAIGAVALMTLLIFVHLPSNRIGWDYRFDSRTAQYNIGVHTYYEAIRGTIVEGLRRDLATQEFRPRWTDISMRLDPATVLEGEPDRKVNLVAANDYHMQLAVESTVEFPLRLANYYFPGWTVILDGVQTLATSPSTNLGLLTADLPPGQHIVDVVWKGTPVQFWGGLISQLTLVLLALCLIWWRPLRGWLLVTIPLLVLALVASYVQPPLVPVQKTELSTSPPGLEFLGYSAPTLKGQDITLSVYWFVTQTQPAPIRTRLQLIAEGGEKAGEVVQELTASPIYNSYSSQYWASNTVVDDGYWLALPSGLAAGVYRLQMTLLNEESDEPYHSWSAGTITVPSSTERPQPSHPLDVRFGDEVTLTGYDLGIVEPRLQRQQTLTTKPEIPVVYPGQTLAYKLYWQIDRQTDVQYIGFLHLLDRWDIAHVQQDHSPGPVFQPSAVWTPYGLYPDGYQLQIPETLPSGLYITDAGMYDWRYEHRFDVTVPGVEGVGDHYEMPPVKVVNRSVQPTGAKVDARFGDFAQLLRFHVESGQEGVQEIASGGELAILPSDTLTLTTYYEAAAPSSTPLTRYVQVRNAQNEILVQYDSEPQEGSNPSWAWVSGEIVVDAIPITLPEDIPDESYTLYLGWYDAAANLAHLPTYNRQGNRLANDEVPLFQLTLAP